MGAKQQEEMIGLLKTNCIYLKGILQEEQLLRKDIAEHSKKQLAGLKAWQEADTEHHLTDNGTLAETVKQMGAAIEKMNHFFTMFIEEKDHKDIIKIIKEKAMEKEMQSYPLSEG